MKRFTLGAVVLTAAVLLALSLSHGPRPASAQKDLPGLLDEPPPAPSPCKVVIPSAAPTVNPEQEALIQGLSRVRGVPSSPASAGAQVPQTALPAGIVGDLVAVLNETKSVDAFLVAVELLQKMGAEARPAVPAVIRNAERLGILKKSALSSGKGNRQEIVRQLLENLERMAGTAGESAAKHQCCSSSPLGAGVGALAGSAVDAARERKDTAATPDAVPPMPPAP
jgi:hypothetical protein